MLNAVVARVGHVDAAIGRNGYATRPLELSGLGAGAADNLIGFEFDFLLGIRILFLIFAHRQRRTVVPHFGDHILADVKPHPVGRFPVRQRSIFAGNAAVKRKIAVEPNLKNGCPHGRVGEGIFDSAPSQVEIVLIRPNHADVVVTDESAAHYRLYFAVVCGANDHDRVFTQVSGWAVAVVVLVVVVAQIPCKRPSHGIIVCHFYAEVVVQAKRNFAHL